MASTALSADWTPPAEVEEYRLLQLIGRGASGLVYLAQDTLLERLVALKFMLAIDADALGRFLIEARATARLQHPNVLTLYRVGQLDDRPFLVSEFVRGTSLAQMAKPLPWREALKVAIGVTRGLAAAHRRGVLHRDIKPGNVMIGSAGEIKVLDFGLAKLDKMTAGSSQAPPPSPSPSPVIVMPQLTHQGLYFGTPFYMAPELWRREPATRRSDIYALGAVLYELCSGRTPLEGIAPHDLPEAAQTRVPRSCASVCNEGDATFIAFAALIDRCLLCDPERRFASAEELLDSLEQLSRTPSAALMPKGNPYRGLQPFDSEHRALFFGRAGEIGAVVERLRSESFVLVVGDSGVGKSSLASAGVLPAVTDGALEDGRRWAALRLKPGRNPFATFVALLAPLLGGDEDALARELRAEPLALSRRLRRMLAADRGLVVFVDQLEELLTVAVPDEAEAFARVLHELAGNIVGARLLATMRSDFLMRLVALPDFGDRISPALYLLRPPSKSGLCAAIVEPARATGISFDSPTLIERLVESTARTEGGLPLLQFTLAQLWEARDEADGTGTISPETLESIGGVEGALARHADDVLDGMLPDERTAARRVLLQLVTVENTRAVRVREELATTAAAEGALAALVRGRLVVVRDSERGATYEVAHEALISGWGTLKHWLSDELARRRAHERLETAARQWDRLQRPDDALWSSKQRSELELLDRGQLKPLEMAFLEASHAAWRRARRGRLLRALGAPLVLVALYGAFAVSARYGVQKKVQRYLDEAAFARASAHRRAGELSALEQRAFAAFDAADLVAGERDYARALALAGHVDDDYARGAEALENALVLDGGERAVRRAIAELIDERARFDEDNRRPVRLRATLARLSLYDADIARRFVAPVRLRLTTTPPAELHLYSYDRADHYRREPVQFVGNSIDHSLAPGSYLVEAGAPGYATVREPLLLERGHDVTVHLVLPRAAAVPPGFVYIPEGTFLFGAAGDENMRREFYRTVPLHPRHTPAYLIAQHETTWAEWIDFLEALPPAERAKRTPRLTAGGFHGSVALERTPSGWHLRFVATTREYQAARGEKIVYESRATAQAQDWLRFPVSGIAWDDVVAYTHWLATSGRVPGARPCREDEWERAARGADGRTFPHGDELAPGDANWEATYGKQPLAFGPDEVGLHPASDSPFGLSDAAGNVWEWTQSVLKPGELVARGGSFYFATPSARSDNRESIEPTLRDITVGVRVCADPAR